MEMIQKTATHAFISELTMTVTQCFFPFFFLWNKCKGFQTAYKTTVKG